MKLELVLMLDMDLKLLEMLKLLVAVSLKNSFLIKFINLIFQI